jgi:hypothetical protein
LSTPEDFLWKITHALSWKKYKKSSHVCWTAPIASDCFKFLVIKKAIQNVRTKSEKYQVIVFAIEVFTERWLCVTGKPYSPLSGCGYLGIGDAPSTSSPVL